jgi:cation diffusion facilitator family transporter
MHSHTVERWQHAHSFLGESHDRHQRRTLLVVLLTALMMVAEIVGGSVFGSMALVADGWHMSTHAGALAIAVWSYHYARKHAHDARYSFGTGKLGDLAGFASAIILGLIALAIGYECVQRLAHPIAISLDEATVIAVVGLAVNLLSAWLLRDDEHANHHAHDLHAQDLHAPAHPHGHDHAVHRQQSHHRDHNLRSAYVHVMADALTSVLAIIALLSARFYGWLWMDPVMGIVGACVIAAWSLSLIRASAAVLLDAVPDPALAETIRDRLQINGDRVGDLHLWRLGPGHLGLIASIVSDHPQAPQAYRDRLDGVNGLSHVTIEVHACPAA